MRELGKMILSGGFAANSDSMPGKSIFTGHFMDLKKEGLVLGGGGLRDYDAEGVLRFWLEERIYFPPVIGLIKWQMVEPFSQPQPVD